MFRVSSPLAPPSAKSRSCSRIGCFLACGLSELPKIERRSLDSKSVFGFRRSRVFREHVGALQSANQGGDASRIGSQDGPRIVHELERAAKSLGVDRSGATANLQARIKLFEILQKDQHGYYGFIRNWRASASLQWESGCAAAQGGSLSGLLVADWGSAIVRRHDQIAPASQQFGFSGGQITSSRNVGLIVPMDRRDTVPDFVRFEFHLSSIERSNRPSIAGCRRR